MRRRAPVPDRRLSVVIPTYGKRALLEQTLGSLETQTYPKELVEVVVVDDCSPDDTRTFLASANPPYTLRTIRHATNRGRAAARNTGVAEATGDLVLFVDDDMRCDRELLAEHVKCHEEHPDSAVIGNALTAPEFGRSTAQSYLDGMGVHRLRQGARAPARYFTTNNASVARKTLLDVGLFDEDFSVYGCEDTEIGFRLENIAGLTFWYCPSAVAYHIHHQTMEQLLAKRLEASRSFRVLLAKHPERAADLSLETLLPPSADDPLAMRLRKGATALLMAPPFCAAVEAVASRFWLGRLSVPVTVYLIACRYRRGLASPSETP
jgi:GT2 family glycosyltransferase